MSRQRFRCITRVIAAFCGSLFLFLGSTSFTLAAGIVAAGPFSGAVQGASVTLLADGRVVLFSGNSASVWNPLERQWETKRGAAMQPARYLHTATLTSDARLVLAGGLDSIGSRQNQQTALSSTTVWRTKPDLWEAGPGLLTPRIAHAAVALRDNDILIIGGAAAADHDQPFGALLATTELLSDKTTVARAPLRTARALHTATLLNDGRVMVIGGIDNRREALAKVEIYDPATDHWFAGPALATARSAHRATLLPDGRVLVTGGVDSDGNPIAQSEIWSGESERWQSAGELHVARTEHAATLLPDGSALIAGGVAIGGDTVHAIERWNPKSSTWEAAGDLPIDLRGISAVATRDAVLLFGADPYSGAQLLAWVADLKDDLQPASVFDATLTPLADGRFLLAGGQRRQAASSSATIYDPANNRWSAAAPMHFPRSGHQALRLEDGRVLVLGGTVPRANRKDGERQSAPEIPAEIWDPATNRWMLSHLLKYASGSWAEPSLLADGRVKLSAVNNESGYGDVLEYFRIWDPTDDSVTALAHVRRTRPGGMAFLYKDGHLLYAGGSDQVQQVTSRACEAIEEDEGSEEERETREPCSTVIESARDGRRLDSFDANTHAWQQVQPAPVTLQSMEFHSLPSGGLIAWLRPKQQSDVEQPMLLWQPASGWQSLPLPPALDRGASIRAAETADHSPLLVINGSQTYVWKRAAREWTPIAHDAKWGAIVDIVNTQEGETLAFRGVSLPGRSFDRLEAVVLNAAAGRWQPNGNRYVQRDFPASVALSDDSLMVAGGGTATVQILNASTGKWRYTGFLPAPLDSPSALRLPDDRVMLAGRTDETNSRVICALWNPLSEQWTACGVFPTDAAGERKPTLLRALDNGQVLLVYGNERALVRDANGTWTATKLNFPQDQGLPYPHEDGTPYAADMGSVWDPARKEWHDATDALLIHRQRLQGAVLPDGTTLYPSGNRLLQWTPRERLFSAIEFHNPSEGNLTGIATVNNECVALWNNSRQLSSGIDRGEYQPSVHVYDIAAKKWSSSGPVGADVLNASAVVLKNNTLVLMGRSRNDVAGGDGWQRFRVSCDSIAAVGAARSLYLPVSGARPSTTGPVIANRPLGATVPAAPVGFVNSWKSSVKSMIQAGRDYPVATFIFGALLLFVLLRLSDRWGVYHVDEDGRAPGRAIDVGILAVSGAVLLATPAAPWHTARVVALIIAAALVALVARRLWKNVEAPEARAWFAAPMGACTVLAGAVIGSTVAGQCVRLIDWLRG